MTVVHKKPFWGLSRAKKYMKLKQSPKAPRQECCSWSHCTTAVMTSSCDPSFQPISIFSEEGQQHEGHTVVQAMVHTEQLVPDTMGHEVTDVALEHEDTPREHAGTLSVDGVMNILECSTIGLSRVLGCDGPRVVD